MKTLVTGSSGFLGGALVERLLAHGQRDLRCLVRAGSNRARLQTLARRYPHLEVFTGSLGSREAAARALDGVNVVYHLAAALGGAAPDMYMNTVVTSKHLLDAMVGRSLERVVLVSSFGVYGVSDLPRGAVIDERTPLEPSPEKRDLYSQTKLRQERLFWEYRERHGLPLVVLRPGVIYGPGGSALSVRVGMNLAGIFLYLGGNNLLPLSFVDNCAEAIAIAGQSDRTTGEVYNVHDDELPTAGAYLARYQREVRRLRVVPIPYPALVGISALVERYHVWSKGQLPAVFTRYRSAASWKGNRFDNAKLKGLGWRPLVSTDDGLRRTFEHLRNVRA